MLSRLLSLFAVLFLAACATESITRAAMPGYEAVQDGEFLIQAVDKKYLGSTTARAEVDYAGPEAAGTIVVDTFARRLYFVMEGGRAMRYAIAVGRQGLAFRGSAYVGRKAEWPSWTPTANMLRTQNETYRDYAGGLPGGLQNPLGARALYLYRGGHDTYFRIHGTADDTSIGRATSAGCIRLFNQDAIDLYDRTAIGAHVKVRTAAESLALEGPIMDDDGGHAVPYVPGASAAADAAVALAAQG
ncbi:MAG: L,D-transpeptidase [Pseudorhodobacter sp.]|nr:L,D-transpeptidase [Pseudorhodobacter sp.]